MDNSKKTADRAKDQSQVSYEQLMDELSAVLKIMENAAASLEDQLVNYEKGMKLCQELEDRLKQAEERILVINAQGQEEEFE